MKVRKARKQKKAQQAPPANPDEATRYERELVEILLAMDALGARALAFAEGGAVLTGDHYLHFDLHGMQWMLEMVRIGIEGRRGMTAWIEAELYRRRELVKQKASA